MGVIRTLGIALFVANITAARAGVDMSADPDLMTPGATVLSYCKHGIFDLQSKYFNFPQERVGGAKKSPLGWDDCRVIDIHKTKLAGETIDGTIVKPEDFEVVLEVKEMDVKGAPQSAKYWFLLSQYDDGWKIVSYSVESNDPID
jgi:hypothetical protein